jgi:hypothetical protein
LHRIELDLALSVVGGRLVRGGDDSLNSGHVTIYYPNQDKVEKAVPIVLKLCILKVVKVVCFDRVSQVFTLKMLCLALAARSVARADKEVELF